MPYTLDCSSCNFKTFANNIVDLINIHTGKNGIFICSNCGQESGYIFKSSALQERDNQNNQHTWDRFIRGVIRIPTDIPTYSPYVFLVSDSLEDNISSLHFNYYKDTREGDKGKLKHGHGPGGAPVLGKKEFLYLIKQLIDNDILKIDEIQNLLKSPAQRQ